MNQNCFHHSLCKTNNGEVCLSNCGRSLRLVYNNISIVQNLDSYMSFFHNVEECYYTVKEESDKENRTIAFTTCSRNMHFHFSITEISELYYLMQSALIEAKVYV